MNLRGIQKAAALGLAMTAGLFPGCAGGAGGMKSEVPGQGASLGPGYPEGSAAWREKERAAYRTGFLAGLQDEKEGFRFDDDRGSVQLEAAVRSFHRQGYRRGYYHEATLRGAERLRSGAGRDSGPAAGESGGAAGAGPREIISPAPVPGLKLEPGGPP